MPKSDTILQITVTELESYGVSNSYVRKSLSLNKSKKGLGSWQHTSAPWDARVKLINYDTIPAATRSKLPTKQKLLELKQAEESQFIYNENIECRIIIEELHKECTNTDDTHFFATTLNDSDKAQELAEAAGWLRLLNQYKSKKDTRSINIDSKDKFRKIAHEIIGDRDDKRGAHLYGFKVANLRTLQNKELTWGKAFKAVIESDSKSNRTLLKQANKKALETLLPKYSATSNRQIIGKPTGTDNDILINGGINVAEWHAKIITTLYKAPGMANKFDYEEVFRRYEKLAKKENVTTVGLRSVKRFLALSAVQLYCTHERNGFASLDKLLPHVKGKKPQYALSKGGYDGFQVDFYTKDSGKRFMLTVVAVFDYMSEAITGYDIGLVENGLMVRNMYRNHLKQMNGISYIELESDRFSGNLAKDTVTMFEQTCRKLTQPTPNDPHGKAPNPKARYVERILQEVNRMAQSLKGWKGTNITSIDSQRKPNPDYAAKNYIEDYNNGVNQIIQLISAYNNVALKKFANKSRMAMCLENLHPNAPEIEVWTQAMLLNQKTISTVRNGVVVIEVAKRKYEYVYPDFDLDIHLFNKRNKVTVYYDETNMDTVDVFGVNDKHLGTLRPLVRVNKAFAEQTDEDKGRAAAMRANRQKSQDRITRKSLEMEASLYDLDISNLPPEEAKAMVLGARSTQMADFIEPFQERFKEELEVAESSGSTAYYQDRLLLDRGLEVPVQVSNSDDRRAYIRNKNKKNPDATTSGLLPKGD